MGHNIFLNSLRFVLVDVILEIFYFPVWWYFGGFKKTISFCWKKIKAGEKRLALGIWIKNIFTPMYGQRDIAGRIISFFIRVAQIFVRLLIFFIWTVIIFTVLLFYIFLPLVALYQIIAQLLLY